MTQLAHKSVNPNNTTQKATVRNVLTVHVDQVQAKPQVRQQFRNIDSLAESLLAEGQQSPIIVSPSDKQGKYTIQKGERRWRACKQAGIPTIDIIINDREQSGLDETAGELIENIQREDLTALEIANALQKFIDQGWKQVDIAKRLGKSTKFVSSHLGLLKLPDCALELYEKGLCADTDTLNVLRQLYELDDNRCKVLCKEAFERGIYRQRARDVLNETYLMQDNAARESSHGMIAPEKYRNLVNSAGRDPGLVEAGRWNSVSAVNLSITVKVMRGRHNRVIGRMLTNRVSPDGKLVWLEPSGDDANTNIICVNASDVRIISVDDIQTHCPQ